MILYVRNTKSEALQVLKELGVLKSERYMGMGIGETIAGYGFDKIIVDVDENRLTQRKRAEFIDWYDNVLRTRLNDPKNDKIINI